MNPYTENRFYKNNYITMKRKMPNMRLQIPKGLARESKIFKSGLLQFIALVYLVIMSHRELKRKGKGFLTYLENRK